ncbi:MAG: transcription-repair coupling factor, partial [Pseudomonadota bacterium]
MPLDKPLGGFLDQPGDITIAGAPEGQDARVLADIVRQVASGTVMHVAADDARAARLTDLLGFFAPDIDVLAFPAWDCLPYDRVSPHGEIIARRVDTLGRLIAREPDAGPLVLMTTVGAASQKVVPRDAISGARFSISAGSRLDMAALRTFLAGNGYGKSETVREPGEFAVRGGIFDLFPPGLEEPVRIDLFGDEVDTLRRFDPSTQRTTGTLDALELGPMAEFFLDEESIARFRNAYRSLFGAQVADDPLYEAISAGRRYGGAEHWLPLFHTEMASLFDYLPEAAVTLDPQFDESLEARSQQIADFFEAREVAMQADRRAENALYRPIGPETLYFPMEELSSLLAQRPVARLSPFGAPPGATDQLDSS